MENMKTTELLDEIYEATKGGDWNDRAGALREELRSREPFFSWTHDNNGVPIEDSIEQTDENVKQLKRHKHDPLNGDVLIRI